VLLLARAKLPAEAREKRILVLCYNRLLASYLAASLPGIGRVKVRTFHAWGRRNGVDLIKGEEDQTFGGRLLFRLHSSARDHGRFDACCSTKRRTGPAPGSNAPRRLREMEADDLIRPEVFPGKVQRVEYSATEFGRSLNHAVTVMADWGKAYEFAWPRRPRVSRPCSRKR
jgi:hypothetical protein